MSHDHTHHQHNTSARIDRAFYIGIALNALFTAIEFVYGQIYGSLALIADATHNLGDVVSLIIALIGLKLARSAENLSFTYGFKKASVLASLINSVILIILVITIFKEGIERLGTHPDVPGGIIIITALIGVVVNMISAYLFYRDQKSDINVKGAYLHLFLDMLVSVGVVISGIIIYFTGWSVIDAVVSLVIGVVILGSTWSLFRESLKLSLDGTPRNVDFDEVRKTIEKQRGVSEVFHIHIWALSSTTNALSAHIILDHGLGIHDWITIKQSIKDSLRELNVHHATLELETEVSHDSDYEQEFHK